MNHRYRVTLGSLLMIAVGPLCASDLKDPYHRDDDVALTEVSVTVSYNESGLYVYTYDLVIPPENTGSINSFNVNIGCTIVPDSRGFAVSDYQTDAWQSVSRDDKHVPAVVDAPWGQSSMFGISEGNEVQWGMVGDPGQVRRGLQIISPYPPGARQYRLVPSMRYREEEWDYSRAGDEDPDLPWTGDMTVTGVITGPACPGEEYPPGDDPEPSRFDGSLFPGQSAELNKLLSYSAPLRDQFHVAPGTREIELIIHYGADMGPRSFLVTPQQRLRGLFNPRPGTSETVRIPLAPGKNRIELQAQTAFTLPGRAQESRGGTPPSRPAGRDPDHLDRDVFVIRVPTEDEPGAPGHGGRE